MSSDLYYREVLQPAHAEERERRAELVARVCPPGEIIDERRPDIATKNADLCRRFARRMKGFIESWELDKGKCSEVDAILSKLEAVGAQLVAAANVQAKQFDERAEELAKGKP